MYPNNDLILTIFFIFYETKVSDLVSYYDLESWVSMSFDDSKFICLENIYKSFGKLEALKNVTVKIEKNKITSIVGDNGSGKSTLIKILSGCLKPNSGIIRIYDKDYKYITPKIAYDHGISTVYQDLSLDNYRDAVGNIFLGREITKFGFILNFKEMKKQTEILLEKIDINVPNIDIPTGYLSGGQRQSIAIARSLFQGKKLLIFDEPTAAMGLKESAATNELIKSLPQMGYTVVMISHDINKVHELSDQIYMLQNGEVIKYTKKEDITLHELKQKIRNDY